MQVIIPMSGVGARFKSAGYDILKPLIPIHCKPIIEYVIDMFPGDHSYIFVCREDHDEEYQLTTYLSSLVKKAKVVVVKPPYKKLGPVYATLQAEDFISDDEPCMVSYCDYYMKWDFNEFEKQVIATGEDGNVICYTGFHPHLLHEKNLYAGCRVDGDLNLLEIKEKFAFDTDKTLGEHSVGAYYFKSGKLLKQYMKKTMECGEDLNGEFYVSLVYPLMLEDGLDIRVYDEVPHFCQWGTPEDLEEYLNWSEIFFKYNYK